MKRIVTFILVVCVCAGVLAGCTTLHGDDDKGANICVYISTFPQSLDPAAVQYTADTALIFGLIYQPLTAIDENGKVVGALAKNWYSYYDDRDEIYKIYFELNETYWSDGILVQAQHVADAWARILSPEMQSPYASLLFPIRNAMAYKSGLMTESDLGVYAESDDLLCVELEQEYDLDLFAEAVSCIALSPIRQQVMDYATSQNLPGSKNYDRLQDWDKNAAILVCNGPYRVQGLEEGTKLVLERNNYYYRDPEEDRLDKSVIPYRLTCIYQETTVAKNAPDAIDNYQFFYNRYKDGKSYFLGVFNKETYQNYANEVQTHDLLSTYSFFFNTKSDVLKNAKTRQALSAALDRTAIVDALGVGYKASVGFVPDGVFANGRGTNFRDSAGSLYSVTADESKAKSLLSEGGVTSGTLKVCYLIPRSSELYLDKLHPGKEKSVKMYNPYEIIAEQAKQAWEKLGFKVELRGVYADSYQSTLASGNWDVIGIDFAVNSCDAIAYLAPFCTTTSGNTVSVSLDAQPYTPHYTGLENADYDKIIQDILYVSDRAQRLENLVNAEKLLAELCPATAVFQYTRSYVMSDKLSKLITDSYYGYYDMHNLRLKNYIEINAREAEESVAADVSQED